MSDGFIEVANHEKFQHYKDRNPPWIKLHASTLDDYALMHLPDAQKWHLVGLWILASKHNNAIPMDPEWIAKRLGCTEPLNLEVLMQSGFLTLERRKHRTSTAQAKRSLNKTRRSDSISTLKKRIETPLFVEAWELYPKRPNNNRAEAWEAWSARLKTGESEAEMLAGTKTYAAWVTATNTEPKYVKQAATFYGPKRHYLNDYDVPLSVSNGGMDEDRYAFLVGEAQRLMDMSDNQKYPDWPLYRDRYKRGERPRRGTLRSAI
jgi:hypothetical protein